MTVKTVSKSWRQHAPKRLSRQLSSHSQFSRRNSAERKKIANSSDQFIILNETCAKLKWCQHSNHFAWYSNQNGQLVRNNSQLMERFGSIACDKLCLVQQKMSIQSHVESCDLVCIILIIGNWRCSHVYYFAVKMTIDECIICDNGEISILLSEFQSMWIERFNHMKNQNEKKMKEKTKTNEKNRTHTKKGTWREKSRDYFICVHWSLNVWRQNYKLFTSKQVQWRTMSPR